WRDDAKGVVVHLHGQHVLPQRAGALRSPGRLASGLHRRKQKRNQDADDRNDDQQLNQRKTEKARMSARNHGRPRHNHLLVVSGKSSVTIEAGLLASGSIYWPRLPAYIVRISLREMLSSRGA